MSTTERWGLAIVAVGMIGMGLLLLGVAFGLAAGGVAAYEPADERPNTYAPAGSESRPGASLALARSAGVDESFGSDMMGPGTMGGNLTPDMMDPGGMDDSFGPGTMGPGMMGGNSGRGVMGR
jgi:hypothetical protein